MKPDMTTASCHPAPAGERMASGVDPDLQRAALNRLKRIEGQVRGLQKMVAGGRYCADILGQVASVQEALTGVSKLLLRNHLRHCVTQAVATGIPAEAEKKYDELVELLGRHWR
jgi:DNA-binding FrmR family transcriptional regulator